MSPRPKLCLALLLSAIALTAAVPRDVLILHSYRVGYDWSDEVSRGLRTKFADAGEYNLWYEFLDARRQGYPGSAASVREHLARIHKGRRFRLIITVDDEALDFIANRSEDIFGTPPVVFCGVNDQSLTASLPRDRYTGLIEVFHPEKFISQAVSLRPNARHLYFVSDITPFGISQHNRFQEATKRSFPNLSFHSIDGRILPLPNIRAAVAAIPPDSILLISQFRQDIYGHYIDATAGETAIAAASPVPVFGVAINRVGQGILMGTPNRGFDHATIAATTALQILNGASPASIPMASDGGLSFLFDHSELLRWNIPETSLPSDAQILNRSPSIWHDYWRWVAAVIALAALQFSIIAGLAIAIARRRKAQSELRAALGAAREADAAKSRFLANMSHELRTPMNGVLGLLQSLQTTDLNPSQMESATLASESARTLLTVLNDILDVSQIDAGSLKIVAVPFSLHQLLPRICSLLAQQANVSGVALSAVIDDSVPPSLTGDSDRLRQIIINLTANALKFTPNGEVRIHASEVSRTPQLSTIRIEVHDSGIGIPSEQMSRIFEPFTQVDSSSVRRFGGVGLGLTISRKLVQLMGGSIGGESTLGEGSVFWLEIPFAYSLESAPASPGVPPAPRLEGRTVLLVEDNSINRLVAQKLLNRTGCHILLAEDGEQCLSRLRESPVDLVLMDVQMPGMSGLETTRQIRRENASIREVPVIALTASSMVGDREECLAAGMNDYLSKPIDSRTLHETLARWLPPAAATPVKHSLH